MGLYHVSLESVYPTRCDTHPQLKNMKPKIGMKVPVSRVGRGPAVSWKGQLQRGSDVWKTY